MGDYRLDLREMKVKIQDRIGFIFIRTKNVIPENTIHLVAMTSNRAPPAISGHSKTNPASRLTVAAIVQ